MNSIAKTSYQNLARRQDQLEAELTILKKIVSSELDEHSIWPLVLKRWERISHDLDNGKGRSFSSREAMKQWLKAL